MGSVTTNQQYQDPSWLASFLQQHEGQTINVQTGPGGMTITVAGESVFIGPSQMGVFSTFKGHDVVITQTVNPQDPFLLLPQSSSFTITDSWVTYFMNYVNPPATDSGSSSYGFSVGGGTPPPDSGLSMTIPTNLTSSTDVTTVYNALLQYTGIADNPGLTAGQIAEFQAQLQAMAQTIVSRNNLSNPNYPDQQTAISSGDSAQISTYLNSLMSGTSSWPAGDAPIFQSCLSSGADTISADEYTIGLQSTDPDTVYQALESFTGQFSSNSNLNSTEQTSFTALLHHLANTVAAHNGPPPLKPNPALLSFDPHTLGAYLMSLVDLSTLPQTDQVLFSNIMSQAAISISCLNAASGDPPPEPDDITNMNSTDSSVILSELETLLRGQGLTDFTGILPKLTQLANNIATANATANGSGLDICDAATLQQALIAILGPEYDPTDPAFQAALLSLATAFAGVNTNYYTLLSQSTDPGLVKIALIHLSNINHNSNLTPAEFTATMNYLSLMAAALAFMSKIRAKIAQLDAEIKLQEAQGKLATIKDQTTAAQDAYNTGIASVNSNLQSTLDAIAHQQLMTWLMPLIMAVMAVVMIAVTIMSAGTLGPVMAALMIASVVVMTTIAITQQQTNFINNIATSLGITDPTAQAGFSAGFQLAIMAIMIIATFGAASGIVAAEAGITIAETVAGQGAQIAIFAVGTTVGILASSGLLTDLFVMMFKAMGFNDQDSQLAGMITTMVFMLLMMLAMAGAAYGASSAAQTTVKAAEGAEEVGVMTLEEEGETIAETEAMTTTRTRGGVDDVIGEPVVGGDVTISPDESSVSSVTSLQRLLARMTELAKDPATYLKLVQALATLAQIGASIEKAIYEFERGDLLAAQANLAKATAQVQALIEYLQSILPVFDITIQDLDATAKSFMQMYTDLMNLFSNMVSSASAAVSQLTQTGS